MTEDDLLQLELMGLLPPSRTRSPDFAMVTVPQQPQRLMPGTMEYLDAMQRGQIPVMPEFRRKKKLTEAELRQQLLEERRNLSWWNLQRYNSFDAVGDQLQ